MNRYPKSVHTLEGATVYMVDAGDKDVLVCEGKAYFGGQDGVNTFELNHETAYALRKLFPSPRPKGCWENSAASAWATGSASRLRVI